MDAKDKLQQIKFQRSYKDILIDLTQKFGSSTNLKFRKSKLGDYYDYFFVEDDDWDIEVITCEIDEEDGDAWEDEFITSRISLFMKEGKLYLILYCGNKMELIDELKKRIKIVEETDKFIIYDIHIYHYEDRDRFLCRLH